MWKIGDIEIKNPIVIAPMAGISNAIFRELCYKFGAGLVYTEMVSDKALCYGNDKTLEMTQTFESEHPLSMQLFGSDVDSMVQAAVYLDQHTACDIIDINMGCPANKIVKNSGGSHLLREPELAVQIVSAVVKAVKKPVTVKMRLGFSHEDINCLELAKRFETAGVKAIALHGRTKTDLYNGNANWEYVKKMKEMLSIPVIGNGDIKTLEEGIARLNETGCDAIMIGRGAIGNPFLIEEFIAYYNGDTYAKPTNSDKLLMCLNHTRALIDLRGERIAIKQMRGIAPWYLRGMSHSARIKDCISQAKTYLELEEIILAYLKQLEEIEVSNECVN